MFLPEVQKVWPEKKQNCQKTGKLHELYGRMLPNTGKLFELYGKVLPKWSSLIFIAVPKNTSKRENTPAQESGLSSATNTVLTL